VLITYFCLRAAMGSRTVPKWYLPFSAVFLVLVCLSVLFVKQHVLVDIPSGFLVGEISVQLAGLGKERE
jgi:membrane-associated phospholipid phosphatase